jgi:hypothetical protein
MVGVILESNLLSEKIVKIDHSLLNEDTLENLIMDIITRQATDYGAYEIDIQIKKNQLKRKIQTGDAGIIYNADEDSCDIISLEDFKKTAL